MYYALLAKIAYYFTHRKAAPLPAADRWAIALAAIYSRVNDGDDAQLAPLSALETATSQNMLSEGWGVTGGTAAERHDQVVGVLDWLARQGHRAALAEPGDHEAVQDLLAWDIARNVMVARHAFHAGFITQAEAWSHIRAAARGAQQAYPSWEEYGRRFLRGRLRWARAHDRRFDKAVDYLVKSRRSPWRRLDWHTPLPWPASETAVASS